MDNGGRDKWKKLPKMPPLRQIFDRWMPEALTMMGALKFLQFLRLLGVRATVSGWRKVSSIFLRGEASKFILASFRLLPDSAALLPAPDRLTAEARLAAKLAAYLRITGAIRYWVEPGRLAFVRHRRRFCDLVLARLNDDGLIVELIPYFDPAAPELEAAESALLGDILETARTLGNTLRELPETRRAPELLARMREWARRESKFNYFGRRRRMWLAQRILHSTILFCEVLPECSDPVSEAKMRTLLPDFRKFRNPGLGMLGAVARFTPDFREFDLWCQFNHVAVDGAPMQEFMSNFKRDWGSAGPVKYPPLPASGVSHTEVRYAGDGIFRAQFFADFQPLLAARTYLNEHCADAMAGRASVAGLVMWGLTRHPAFARKKLLLPVDAGARNGDRDLGLLMIRPRQFARRRRNNPLADYCDFQREMNRRMEQARTGAGAVSEFLELCALMHPFFYHAAQRLWPRALNEVLGTAGLTILKDAELFISPMTDFQSGGFIAIGNLAMPTVDGGTAAAVSITGRRTQIRNCLAAARHLSRDLPATLGLPDGWRAGRLCGESEKLAKIADHDLTESQKHDTLML